MSDLEKQLSNFKQRIKNSSVPSQRRVVSSASSSSLNSVPSASTSTTTSLLGVANSGSLGSKSTKSPIKKHQESLKRSSGNVDEQNYHSGSGNNLNNNGNSNSNGNKRQKPTLSVSGSQLSTQLHLAVEFIKSQDYSIPVSKLEDYLSADVTTNLLPLLSNIDRIKYDPHTGMIEYMSLHNIRSSADLLGFLRSQPIFKGISIKELKDGWNGCMDSVNELEKQHKVIVLRKKKENAARLVFPNLGGEVGLIDEEFVNMWSHIKLPEGDSLQIKLNENGLKPTSMGPLTKKKPIGTESKKLKKPRRVKLTNTHMKGILKDYNI
ncbi:hypothetical protein PACTADRAFT_50964 [Pachysolen tannophilus NRRL Y-2460]|uniref:Transcription initiation factor IIE subunit beta n=1 Tax=Pachysolen tannophilus NRRL Y-2460 TaxID=669874 RepID=A0A1E4TQN1_PACTA|nr:hypothetical protein PACTADRAFT_50964 [Pachysolen tannophilus NRRL Y-2460]